jgi:hypothetical protein
LEKRESPFISQIEDAGLAAKSYFFVSWGKERKKKRRNPWGREEYFESTPPLFLLNIITHSARETTALISIYR